MMSLIYKHLSNGTNITMRDRVIGKLFSEMVLITIAAEQNGS